MLRERWIFGRRTPAFTLQWHLTNACRFHCRHCYDRSVRSELPLDRALGLVTELRAFCAGHGVAPRASLTGGDPLCYAGFWKLYEALARAAVPCTLLGNPVPGETIHRLMSLYPPLFYQVSLEGLREHNDFMRGAGHYDRTLGFLREARRMGLHTHVMLTLTRANLDQVLPLGEALRGLAGRFTFNRVAAVGEAANIDSPTREEFVALLRNYLVARRHNPVLGVKDNLFNIIRWHLGRPLYPGCTGFGCGAAFNFVALLPDGEVHACRKFPSLLGNIREQSFARIYNSPAARRYRRGPEACRGCPVRRDCGGCLAVAHGAGLDPLHARDPHCFFEQREALLRDF